MDALLATHRLDVRVAARCLCAGLDLSIRPGQCWALLGPNGAGKTTLLHHLAGLRPAPGGEVMLLGDSVQTLTPRERARRLSMLLQHSNAGLGAEVLETVLTGRHPHLPALAWEGHDDLEIAHGLLHELGLADLATRRLDTLSGGELRRVEIARLLAQRTPMTLLDEPFNHLDLANQSTCLRVVQRHCVGSAQAMLMVVHDLNLAFRSCDHWLLLGHDATWHAGPRERLANPQLLGEVYRHPVRRIDTHHGPVFIAGP